MESRRLETCSLSVSFALWTLNTREVFTSVTSPTGTSKEEAAPISTHTAVSLWRGRIVPSTSYRAGVPPYAQLPPPILPFPSLSSPGFPKAGLLVETGLLHPGSRGDHTLRPSGLLLIFRR
jgi:hypothetical protein